jgi:hypothetical protein
VHVSATSQPPADPRQTVPAASIKQDDEQQSPFDELPSSHCSLPPTTPSPHALR